MTAPTDLEPPEGLGFRIGSGLELGSGLRLRIAGTLDNSYSSDIMRLYVLIPASPPPPLTETV